MSETLKNNSETANDGGQNNWETAMADAPKYDADAAQKARNEAYEASHPYVVKDVEAARAAAKAGDYYETELADMKIAARKNMEDHGTFADKNGDLVRTRDHSKSSDPDIAADFTKGSSMNHSIHKMTDKDVLDQIEERRRYANNEERAALEDHFKKQTKLNELNNI